MATQFGPWWTARIAVASLLVFVKAIAYTVLGKELK